MSHLADVNQDGKPKLSRTAQNLLRASLGNARIAVRQAITASNMAAAVFLDAEAVAGLARDQGAERALDALGAAVLTHASALEGLRRKLDLVSVSHEPKTKAASAPTAPAAE
jgi:hypothetical protein